MSALRPGSLCRGACAAFVGAGLTLSPWQCPSVLCSLPALGGFLPPLVKAFAVRASRGFWVPSEVGQRFVFTRLGRRNSELFTVRITAARDAASPLLGLK